MLRLPLCSFLVWYLTDNLHLACTAYSRYILDVGQSEDWLALQMALAPCLIGYGAIAKRLHSDKGTLREGNKYWKWIENYVAEDYAEAVRLGSGKILHIPPKIFFTKSFTYFTPQLCWRITCTRYRLVAWKP